MWAICAHNWDLTRSSFVVNIRPRGFFPPSGEQLTAGRAAAGLSVQALAEQTGLGVNTVRRAEAGGAAVLTAVNAERLVAGLEALGITFLEADANGPGVRIRKPD